MSANQWYSSLSAIASHVGRDPKGANFHYPIRHGTMRAGAYWPGAIDDQTPHDQDELYIIAAGTACFVKGDERLAVRPQDVLFVEAQFPHHFEAMSADFAVWVIFWGPEGGEALV